MSQRVGLCVIVVIGLVSLGCSSEGELAAATVSGQDVTGTPPPKDSTVAQGETCVPSCGAGSCGDDGCGGTCACAPGSTCDAASKTCKSACVPACSGKDCGDNGCGGSCGNCLKGTCTAGKCVSCEKACDGKDCGDDGCGGTCGTCTTGTCGGAGVAGKCGSCVAETPCTIGGAPVACMHGSTDCSTGSAKCVAVPDKDGTTCGTGKACQAGKCLDCLDGAPCAPDKEPCKKGTISCGTGVAQCVASGSLDNGTACPDGVCHEGSCKACVPGAACDVADGGCLAGSLACDTGLPVCKPSISAVKDGTVCKTGYCKGGLCLACNHGVSCQPKDQPCRSGTTDCTSGSQVCVAGDPLTNGLACNVANVCLDGDCVACAAGEPCDPDGELCKTGKTSCATGKKVCVAGDAKSDGATCDIGKVCLAGACVGCVANKACVPEKACALGLTSCATGVETCVAGAAVQNGTECSGGACQDGSCVPCNQGATCASPTNECLAGTVDCQAGKAVCVNLSAVTEATPCAGGGSACFGGVCTSCASGGACPLADKCLVGTVSCDQGVPQCTWTGNTKPDGASCDTGAVCTQGICQACAEGNPCVPPDDPCHVGAVSCATGLAVCKATATLATNGAPCDGGVCKAGACVPCVAGTACLLASSPCTVNAIGCGTGDPVCAPTAENVLNGTACDDGKVCNAGTCVACTAGKVCPVGGKPCHEGLTSCASGVESCVDSGAAKPDGSSCAGGYVCKSGECVTCEAGKACTPLDSCGLGKTSCATGVSTCVTTGPAPGSEGQPCGFDTGLCQNGKCTCQPGEVFFLGGCSACPDLTTTTLHVDADAQKGLDNACCGRSTQVGQLGGPCRTITQAVANVPGAGYMISVAGDSLGNVSPTETYPIHPHSGVHVALGTACVPGTKDKPIFEVDVDPSTVAITSGTLGVSCQGVPGSASEAIYVHTNALNEAPVVSVSYTSIRRVGTAVRVVGGSAGVGQIAVSDVTTAFRVDGGDISDNGSTVLNAGSALDCRSVSKPETDSKAIIYGVYYSDLKQRGVWAGHRCKLDFVAGHLGSYTGVACPLSKKGSGFTIDGDAKAKIAFSTIRCHAGDGISVQKDVAYPAEQPEVAFENNIVSDNGCVGLLADHGKVTAFGNRIVKNHWGVVQKGSLVLTEGNIRLVGQDAVGNTSRNVIACNSKAVAGACCTQASCPNGYDVWNNSASPLDATFNAWEQAPVTQYTCDAVLGSCICAFTAQCLVTPPDGTSVVNSPQSSGTPKTNTKNNALMDQDYCL